MRVVQLRPSVFVLGCVNVHGFRVQATRVQCCTAATFAIATCPAGMHEVFLGSFGLQGFFCFVADFSRIMMDETWLVPSMGFPRLPFPIIETEIPLLLGSMSSSVKTCACIVFAFVSVGRVTITEYRTCAITSSFSWQLAETG